MTVRPQRPRRHRTRTWMVRALAITAALGVLAIVPTGHEQEASAATPAPVVLQRMTNGFSAPMKFAPPMGTSEVFSGAAVGNNLLGRGGTQVAVGGMNGCVIIYDLGDLARAPACIYTGPGPVHATPVLTDLNRDGYLDLVTANGATGTVYGFKGSANGLSGKPFFARSTTATTKRAPGVFATPAVGDIDGDGGYDIVATSWNHFVFAWHLNGALVRGFPRFLYDTLWSSPALKDLNRDGRPEIIFGGDMDKYAGAPYPYGGLIWVLRGDASNYPGFPRTINGQVVWSSPAVGDIDANGGMDMVFGTGEMFPDTGHNVYALNSGGYALPGWSYKGKPGVNLGSIVMSSPALGKLVNGDSRLYTALVTGQGYTVVLNPNGTKRWAHCDNWTATCPPSNSHHGSVAIADVNGDGQQDVVSFPGKRMRIYNGSTGAMEADSGDVDPCCQIRTFAPAAAPTITRVGNDTIIVAHGIYDANGNGRRDTGDRDHILVWKVPNASPGHFDWPTFKQNQRRTGTGA